MAVVLVLPAADRIIVAESDIKCLVWKELFQMRKCITNIVLIMQQDVHINDYAPLPDVFPDLNLVLASRVQVNGIKNFAQTFDYVQELRRKNKNGYFYLLAKVVSAGYALWGVLYHYSTLFRTTDRVALPANYESIDFIYIADEAFSAIVKLDGKYGIFCWQYRRFASNSGRMAVSGYDTMFLMDNGRVKGVKDGNVTYFDVWGHVLR